MGVVIGFLTILVISLHFLRLILGSDENDDGDTSERLPLTAILGAAVQQYRHDKEHQ